MSADPRTFNDDQAAIRKGRPVERFRGEFFDAHELVMRRAAAITADSWREVGTIPRYGPEHCLNDRVVCTMLRSFRGAADVLARPVHAEDLPVRPLRE